MREMTLEMDTLQEIASEVMNRGGSISFRARVYGSCMLPFVRDGAVITVVPVDPISVRRADVVAHRSGGGFGCHRVVRRCYRSGALVLYTRGDVYHGQSTQLSAEHIIGKVVAVSHRGRTIPMGNALWRFLGLVWLAATPVSQIILGLAIRARNFALRLVVP